MGICASCDTQPHCHNFHHESNHYNAQQQKCHDSRNECVAYYSHTVPKLDHWYNDACGSVPPYRDQLYREQITKESEYHSEYYQPPQANNIVKHITVSSSPTNYYNR